MTVQEALQINTRHVVTTDWLSSRLDDPNLHILDVRLAGNYAEGHIPGAQHLDLNAIRGTIHGVESMLLQPDDFANTAGALGIDSDSQIVIYDDHFGLVASRVAWSFLRYGVTQVALLDGGWDAWESKGYSISTDIPKPQPADFIPRPVDDYAADLDQVRAAIHAPDTLLLDVRSPAEYEKGSIPNAVWWNWENGTDLNHVFGDLTTLQSQLQALGVTPDKTIITYCQAGVRAAHTFLLLRESGYPQVRMYDGSWAEWSQVEKQGAR